MTQNYHVDVLLLEWILAKHCLPDDFQEPYLEMSNADDSGNRFLRGIFSSRPTVDLTLRDIDEGLAGWCWIPRPDEPFVFRSGFEPRIEVQDGNVFVRVRLFRKQVE